MKSLSCPICKTETVVLNIKHYSDYEIKYHSWCDKCKVSIEVYIDELPIRPEGSE